jgi:hypothetical protein
MIEEKLTKTLLAWLETNGWEIVAFDFPQSGTGVMLHPAVAGRIHKNSNAIIPDIIASKNGKVAVFENKKRFTTTDFEKVALAKSTKLYNSALLKLFNDILPENIFWGIGITLSDNNWKKVTPALLHKVDFVIFVDERNGVTPIGEQKDIFANS